MADRVSPPPTSQPINHVPTAPPPKSLDGEGQLSQSDMRQAVILFRAMQLHGRGFGPVAMLEQLAAENLDQAPGLLALAKFIQLRPSMVAQKAVASRAAGPGRGKGKKSVDTASK